MGNAMLVMLNCDLPVGGKEKKSISKLEFKVLQFHMALGKVSLI